MQYEIHFKCPDGWKHRCRRYVDEMGVDIVELDAQGYKRSITASVCDMPADETALDQAFANYIDCIGFDGDQDSEIPVGQFPFNGRKAYGWASYDENGNVVRLFTQEVRKGVLATFYITAETVEELNAVQDLAERNIRIKIIS